MPRKVQFAFGQNWQRFLKFVNENRVRQAAMSLATFLGLKDLQDKSFVDIGCGSGLFSYAAFNLGAKRIVSFDSDALAVDCCSWFHKKANSPANWEIYQGSILDESFIRNLGRFDVVYAWGVLHHTGDLWESIGNSANLVQDHGFYYITVYNKVDRLLGSAFWRKIKKLYNSTPPLSQQIIKALFLIGYATRCCARLENPLNHIRSHEATRGMCWKSDLNDWLGGYPYDCAESGDVVNFVKSRHPEFSLANIKATSGLANNWFLFRRNGITR